ncbi:MAG: 50S ribosomal protein L35 [Bdellovibrionales bacterium]|nr:50S ribosomal protein L35 [Bdellovibrionales bacterium]
MSKMKTKKGAAKRVRVTKSGKIKLKRSHLRHILTPKTTKQKRQKRGAMYASPADEKALQRAIPYGIK